MNFKTMEIPTTRSEFEHRFHLLENAIQNGKMSIGPNVSRESLLKVRRLPNGRLDFLSVDEMARLQANTMLSLSKMDFPKNIDDSDPSSQN
jgi:hypothetical protein